MYTLKLALSEVCACVCECVRACVCVCVCVYPLLEYYTSSLGAVIAITCVFFINSYVAIATKTGQ